MCRFKQVLRDRTVGQSSRSHADAKCSPALPRMELLGFHRSLSLVGKSSLSQDSLPRSPCKTRRFSALCGVSNKNSSVFSVLPKTLLWFIGAPVRHHLHHGFETNKLLQTAPVHCRTPLPRACAHVFRLSPLTRKRWSTHDTVLYHPAHQAMICSHINSIRVRRLLS